MQVFIMTVGTSLLSNWDRELPEGERRPWKGLPEIGDRKVALDWMRQQEMMLISAETNTLYQLDPQPDDAVILLRSDTPSGLECAEVLKAYFMEVLGQTSIEIRALPGINYDPDSGSSLERMGELLRTLIGECLERHQAVTFAATGGFKAEAMVLGIIGHQMGIPVCYVHEKYRSIIYLPHFDPQQYQPIEQQRATLPVSGRDRDSMMQVSTVAHHRPKSWKKIEKALRETLWIDGVRFAQAAFNAPRNGVKLAREKTPDGCFCYWLHLYEDEDHKIAIAVDTTGYRTEHHELALRELREMMSKIR